MKLNQDLEVVAEMPKGKSFVAVWLVAPRNELFSASFHYMGDVGLYVYSEESDSFLGPSEHGFSESFLKRMGATFFVVNEEVEV